jgi:hypothetical protein
MTCPACTAYGTAERCALRDEPMPEHALDGCTCPTEPTVAITLIGTNNWGLGSPTSAIESTWAELVRWISAPIVTTDKASAGGFVLARLREGIRRKDHVITVSSLAFEHDAGTYPIGKAHEALSRYRHVVYSTWSSTPEHPRWRAIIATSKEMTPDEHSVVWNVAARRIDAPLDAACKDPCRLWYAPTVRSDGSHQVLHSDGSVLDVDAVVAGARTTAAKAKTTAAVSTATKSTGDEYIAKAIERECRSVAAASSGERNKTLNRATYSLARFDRAILPADVIERSLLAAARQAGLSEHEAKRTILSGLTARRGAS